MPHPYTLIAGMVNPKLRFKSRAMNHYVSSHLSKHGSGPHHFALTKQFSKPVETVGSALVQHRKLKSLQFKF